jgi:hypothetical protein
VVQTIVSSAHEYCHCGLLAFSSLVFGSVSLDPYDLTPQSYNINSESKHGTYDRPGEPDVGTYTLPLMTVQSILNVFVFGEHELTDSYLFLCASVLISIFS